VSVKFTLQNSDDQLGHALVDVSQRFRDTWHNTGDIEWQRSSCQ
jgi:hypothetical protein